MWTEMEMIELNRHDILENPPSITQPPMDDTEPLQNNKIVVPPQVVNHKRPKTPEKDLLYLLDQTTSLSFDLHQDRIEMIGTMIDFVHVEEVEIEKNGLERIGLVDVDGMSGDRKESMKRIGDMAGSFQDDGGDFIDVAVDSIDVVDSTDVAVVDSIDVVKSNDVAVVDSINVVESNDVAVVDSINVVESNDVTVVDSINVVDSIDVVDSTDVVVDSIDVAVVDSIDVAVVDSIDVAVVDSIDVVKSNNVVDSNDVAVVDSIDVVESNDVAVEDSIDVAVEDSIDVAVEDSIDVVESNDVAVDSIDVSEKHQKGNSEEEVKPVTKTSNPLIRKPINRSLNDGPAKPVSQIQASVRRTNPVYDELLFTMYSCARNDPSLAKIEIIDYLLTQSQASALATSISTNTHVKSLVLDGCGIQTAAGSLFAKALCSSTCSIEKISFERNAMGPQAMKHFAKMIAVNTSLSEIRLGVQASITPMGLEAEQSFAESMQKNNKIIKLALVCTSAHFRDSVGRSVMRNKEIARKARVAAAKAERSN